MDMNECKIDHPTPLTCIHQSAPVKYFRINFFRLMLGLEYFTNMTGCVLKSLRLLGLNLGCRLKFFTCIDCYGIAVIYVEV